MVKIKFSVLVLAILLSGCEPDKPDPLPTRCYLKPEIGPCEAAIPRYYYDQKDGECKEFIWGGCQGVVPFETMEACQKSCGE